MPKVPNEPLLTDFGHLVSDAAGPPVLLRSNLRRTCAADETLPRHRQFGQPRRKTATITARLLRHMPVRSRISMTTTPPSGSQGLRQRGCARRTMSPLRRARRRSTVIRRAHHWETKSGQSESSRHRSPTGEPRPGRHRSQLPRPSRTSGRPRPPNEMRPTNETPRAGGEGATAGARNRARARSRTPP